MATGTRAGEASRVCLGLKRPRLEEQRAAGNSNWEGPEIREPRILRSRSAVPMTVSSRLARVAAGPAKVRVKSTR